MQCYTIYVGLITCTLLYPFTLNNSVATKSTMVNVLSPPEQQSSRCNTGTTKALCIIHTSKYGSTFVDTHYMCRYIHVYKALTKKRNIAKGAAASILCLGMPCMQNLQGLWLGTTNGCGQSCMIHTLSYHSKYQTYPDVNPYSTHLPHPHPPHRRYT